MFLLPQFQTGIIMSCRLIWYSVSLVWLGLVLCPYLSALINQHAHIVDWAKPMYLWNSSNDQQCVKMPIVKSRHNRNVYRFLVWCFARPLAGSIVWSETHGANDDDVIHSIDLVHSTTTKIRKRNESNIRNKYIFQRRKKVPAWRLADQPAMAQPWRSTSKLIWWIAAFRPRTSPT